MDSTHGTAKRIAAFYALGPEFESGNSLAGLCRTRHPE
jgi:hypothetical protein